MESEKAFSKFKGYSCSNRQKMFDNVLFFLEPKETPSQLEFHLG